ncbi:hypothetical protein LUQ84_001203 [Hamiltosporidium tvaerminnensis]|nr:hypothetical protein LUQ84_001203 [Hamiltosporidium tvaerminnensis]
MINIFILIVLLAVCIITGALFYASNEQTKLLLFIPFNISVAGLSTLILEMTKKTKLTIFLKTLLRLTKLVVIWNFILTLNKLINIESLFTWLCFGVFYIVTDLVRAYIYEYVEKCFFDKIFDGTMKEIFQVERYFLYSDGVLSRKRLEDYKDDVDLFIKRDVRKFTNLKKLFIMWSGQLHYSVYGDGGDVNNYNEVNELFNECTTNESLDESLNSSENYNLAQEIFEETAYETVGQAVIDEGNQNQGEETANETVGKSVIDEGKQNQGDEAFEEPVNEAVVESALDEGKQNQTEESFEETANKAVVEPIINAEDKNQNETENSRKRDRCNGNGSLSEKISSDTNDSNYLSDTGLDYLKCDGYENFVFPLRSELKGKKNRCQNKYYKKRDANKIDTRASIYAPIIEDSIESKDKESKEDPFKNLFISIESLATNFEYSIAKKIFNLISFNSTNKIDYESFKIHMGQIENERFNLYNSLKDFDKLHLKFYLTLFFFHTMIFCTVLAIYNEIRFSLLTLSIPIFLFCLFPSIKRICESFFFIVFTHPYDSGDKVNFGDENMIVRKINLLSTTFEKWNGEKVYVSNQVINKFTVRNIRRSKPQFWNLQLGISINTDPNKIDILRERLEEYCKMNQAFNSATVNCDSIENVNMLILRIIIKHTSNFQNGYFMWTNHTNFMYKLKSILEELDVHYIEVTKSVDLFQNKS